jgi:fructosamine-3-kinase
VSTELSDSAGLPYLAGRITEATGKFFQARAGRRVGGGCINDALVLEGTDGRRYFVKTNLASRVSMFEAEAEGLAELRAAPGGPRAPAPVCTGAHGDLSYLILEYIESGPGNAKTQERLGTELAALHRRLAPEFGWRRDNTIGSTPQPNDRTRDWVAFLRERRLGFQLKLAQRNGYDGRLLREGERLLAVLGRFFDRPPVPSLLHGDLWGGNSGADRQGRPVIFDPAVYYGDREADLAMTELFGGYTPDFYAAYHEAWPLDAGYGTRKTLYNLYHVLNHLNLFGGGYRAQAAGMIERLLSEV